MRNLVLQNKRIGMDFKRHQNNQTLCIDCVDAGVKQGKKPLKLHLHKRMYERLF